MSYTLERLNLIVAVYSPFVERIQLSKQNSYEDLVREFDLLEDGRETLLERQEILATEERLLEIQLRTVTAAVRRFSVPAFFPIILDDFALRAD